MTAIADDAFLNCSSLTSVTIPASVTNMGHRVFQGCSSLSSTYFEGDAPAGFGNNVFQGVDANHLIYYKASSTGFTSPTWNGYPTEPIEDRLSYEIVGETIRITDFPTDATGPVLIPESIQGKPVTSIKDFAFSSCSSLTRVTLPSGMTHIGVGAFQYCSSLIEMTMPSGVVSIGANAFSGCASLTVMDIPSGVTSIGVGAFQGCSSLSTVTIPGGITTISEWTFNGCSGLTRVTLPNGVNAIGDYAFYECSNLTGLRLPSALTSIGLYAFRGCSNLTSIEIPSGFTTMGGGAFYNCSKLQSTYFKGDAPATFGGIVFGQVDANHVIYFSDTSAGFTSPTWNGYPTQMIDTAAYPFAAWLLESNLSYDADIHQDLNGDGVSLLMAYALDLNPNKHLSEHLPTAELNSTTLSLKYYGGKSGVTYQVKTSKDLKTWATTGLTISAPDGDGMVTASIPRGEVCGFLRLVVNEN